MMASRSGVLYIGVSSDLTGRVWEHKAGEHEGFSKTYRCTKLVWFEAHTDVVTAIAREKQLNRWRREKKIVLVQKENPFLLDLAVDWYGDTFEA